MTSLLGVTLSRSLHSRSFFVHRIPRGLSAVHRHIVANKVNVVMNANQMSKTLTTASTATAAPEVSSSSPSSLSPNPTLFAIDVLKMERKELNRLDLRTIPSWARSIVDQERCRRKKQEPQSIKSKKESIATTPIATTATTLTTAAATVTAANPTFNLDLPAEKSDIALVEFKDKLLTMDRRDLNLILMKDTPSWARSLINEERYRRKKMHTIVMKSGPESLALSKKASEAEVVVTAATRTTAVSMEAAAATTTPLPATAAATSRVATKVPAATVAKATIKLNLPTKKSETASAELIDKMQKLTRNDLAKIDMKATPTWARRLINEELCSRKKTKAIVESTPKSLTISVKAAKSKAAAPAIEATTHAATVISISSPSSDSGSNQGVIKVQQQKKGKRKTKTPRQRPATGDGAFLHALLVEAAAKKADTPMWDCDIIYDPSLQKSELLDDNIKQKTRELFGKFHCISCRVRGEQRIWGSAEVFTQFWFKYTPANGRSGLKDTLRYESLIHFQKCRGCEEYMHADVDHESYVKTMIKAFELWAKRRDREYRDSDSDSEKFTDPHDTTRCHGCISGLHHPEDHAHGYSTSYLKKFMPGK